MPPKESRILTVQKRSGKSVAGGPDFLAPPVVEVVVSVGFNPLPRLRTIALGQLWDSKFKASFPRVEEQPPFRMPVERLDKVPSRPSVTFQVSKSAPLPRLLFLNQDGTEVVQVQNDWFARNWRKTVAGSDYPRYTAMRDRFESDLRTFVDYLARHNLGGFVPIQCEISYVNQVLGTNDIADVIGIITGQANKQLPRPEATRLSTQFLISDGERAIGRLHVSANPAVRNSDGTQIVVVTVTARGRPDTEDVDGVLSFLDIGASWALRGFLGLTRPKMQQLWGIRE